LNCTSYACMNSPNKVNLIVVFNIVKQYHNHCAAAAAAATAV
jgi:hypothetical protein